MRTTDPALPGISSRRHRRPLLAMAATATLLLATAIPATANLTGSSFEGGDGNLVVDTTGNHDWTNAPNRVTGIDLPTGSSDNAFGQGTKEDVSAVSIVTGSIPPNKNDLQRFYVANEQLANGHILLYLAWERLVNIGNANIDFEINQKATTGFDGTTTGKITLNRTAGDLLVTYDFGGSGTPTLGLETWVTSGSVSQCFSANSLPCWGNHVALNGTDSEGAVNAGTVSEPIIGGGANLTAGLFGEAAVDLTAADVFQPGVCEAFGSTFVKSRSSSSFTAEVKDFIAPQPVNISNCGSITVDKVISGWTGTSPQFGFTATNLFPTSFNLIGGGTQVYNKLGSGIYTVTEGAEPSSQWTLTGFSCTDGTTGYTGSSYAGTTATVTLAPGQNVTCTYTNTFAKVTPGETTAQNLLPNDSFTLSGWMPSSSTPGGTVTFTLYGPNDLTCAGTAVYTQSGLTLNSSGTAATTNTTHFVTSPGTYSWKVTWTGDDYNNAVNSVCGVEQFTLTNTHAANS